MFVISHRINFSSLYKETWRIFQFKIHRLIWDYWILKGRDSENMFEVWNKIIFQNSIANYWWYNNNNGESNNIVTESCCSEDYLPVKSNNHFNYHWISSHNIRHFVHFWAGNITYYNKCKHLIKYYNLPDL